MMAIEHSKAPAAQTPTHGATKAAGKAASVPSGGASSGGLGFASLLASTEEEACGMEAPTPVAGAPKGDPAPGKGSLAGDSRRAPSVRSDVSPARSTSQKDQAEEGRESKAAVQDAMAATLGLVAVPTLAAQVPSQMPTTSLGEQGASGVIPQGAEGGDISAAAPRWGGGSPRGLVSTQQLQQSMAPGGKYKTAEHGAEKPFGAADSGTSEGFAPGVASRVEFARDFLGKAGAMATADASSPPAVMDLVSSIIGRTHAQGSPRDGEYPVPKGGAGDGESSSLSPQELTELVDGTYPPEELVSEPVRFWVGGDQAQRADMTVDDVGGGSVDVTIRLQGKEAHVVFRADESVARDALQSGSGQLKDLLGQGGLTLSGMSVGTSAGDGASSREGAKDGKPTGAPGKVTRVAVDAATTQRDATGMVAGPRSAGRGVDLYV